MLSATPQRRERASLATLSIYLVAVVSCGSNNPEITTSTDAQTDTDFSWSPDTPTVDSEPDVEPPRSCSGRTIEVQDESGEWVVESVCDRGQVCSHRGCVRPTEGLGEPCTNWRECQTDYGCYGGFCLSEPPYLAGGRCTIDLDCLGDLRCSPRGVCQAGLEGDPCHVDGDCRPDFWLACSADGICENNRYRCNAEDGCPEGLVCVTRLGECWEGLGDDACDDDFDCNRVTHTCSEPDLVCRHREYGERCESHDECPGFLYCENSLCQDGATGDYCGETSQCRELDDICADSPPRCRDRQEGDTCETSAQCPVVASICSSALVCQDGGLDDPCSAQEDCSTEFYCPDTGQCQPTISLGESCDESVVCGSGYCSNEHCSPEGFAYIPAGTFCMGSPGNWDSEGCPDDEYPRHSTDLPFRRLHEVTLTNHFLLQETEVTQSGWLRLFELNASQFDNCGLDCPVDEVSWWAALAYANALSESEGLPACFELRGCDEVPYAGAALVCEEVSILAESLYHCEGYRLPTEAEWEYAYRAGSVTDFYNGPLTDPYGSIDAVDDNLDAIGWYRSNSGVEYDSRYPCSSWFAGAPYCGSHPVAQKVPNVWGLYDMSGNTWEWVWDAAASYPDTPTADPVGPDGAFIERGNRGGGFTFQARSCTGASRRFNDSSMGLGLRLARTVHP